MEHTLYITFNTSRGRNTYGYGLVTLYERGEKKATTCGGGYDMRGTVFADWLQSEYQDRLKKIARRMHYHYTKGKTLKPNKAKNNLYGGTWNKSDNTVSLDGGCGFSSIVRIAEAIGLKVRQIDAGKKQDIVLVSEAHLAQQVPE